MVSPPSSSTLFPTRRSSDLFYWEDLVNPVDARYVRVEIRARSAWTMIAEVAVQTGAAEPEAEEPDRKSTRLNSSHVASSYAVFCVKRNSAVGGAASRHRGGA